MTAKLNLEIHLQFDGVAPGLVPLTTCHDTKLKCPSCGWFEEIKEAPVDGKDFAAYCIGYATYAAANHKCPNA